MRAGNYDNAWLDRLTASRPPICPRRIPWRCWPRPSRPPKTTRPPCRPTSWPAAARGRPALPDTVGHRLQLVRPEAPRTRCGSTAWAAVTTVSITGAGLADVNVQRLGRYERAITCLGQRYQRRRRQLQGPRLVIEVDGSPHIITRDDGGQVRCPAPAFVVAVLVAPGDTVRAGDPLVVVESMKMESTITAPHAGTVRSVLAQVNTQVGGRGAAGPAAAARLSRNPGQMRRPGGRLRRARLPGGPQSPSPRENDRAAPGVPARLRHRGRATPRELSRRQSRKAGRLPPDDAGVLGRSRSCWRSSPTSPPCPGASPTTTQDAHARSLAGVPAHLSGIPRHRNAAARPTIFARQLRTALARYGVPSLARTPELEQALLRIYRSVGPHASRGPDRDRHPGPLDARPRAGWPPR